MSCSQYANEPHNVEALETQEYHYVDCPWQVATAYIYHTKPKNGQSHLTKFLPKQWMTVPRIYDKQLGICAKYKKFPTVVRVFETKMSGGTYPTISCQNFLGGRQQTTDVSQGIHDLLMPMSDTERVIARCHGLLHQSRRNTETIRTKCCCACVTLNSDTYLTNQNTWFPPYSVPVPCYRHPVLSTPKPFTLSQRYENNSAHTSFGTVWAIFCGLSLFCHAVLHMM